MAQGSSNKKAASNLVSASCAAVLAVYVTGYVRTQNAANRLAAQIAERRVAVRDPFRTASPITELRPAAPNAPVDTNVDTPVETQVETRVGAPSPAPAISSAPARVATGKRSKIALSAPIPTAANAPGVAAGLRPPKYRRRRHRSQSSPYQRSIRPLSQQRRPRNLKRRWLPLRRPRPSGRTERTPDGAIHATAI
jgi:hypothetical protein